MKFGCAVKVNECSSGGWTCGEKRCLFYWWWLVFVEAASVYSQAILVMQFEIGTGTDTNAQLVLLVAAQYPEKHGAVSMAKHSAAYL